MSDDYDEEREEWESGRHKEIPRTKILEEAKENSDELYSRIEKEQTLRGRPSQREENIIARRAFNKYVKSNKLNKIKSNLLAAAMRSRFGYDIPIDQKVINELLHPKKPTGREFAKIIPAKHGVKTTVHSPTLILAGEEGKPEKVHVKPLNINTTIDPIIDMILPNNLSKGNKMATDVNDLFSLGDVKKIKEIKWL